MEDGGRWRFPWGLAFSLALIAAVLTGLLRVFPAYRAPVSWEGVGAALLIAVAAFLVMRWLVSWLAGMVAAFLITLTPVSAEAARNGTLLPEGLVLLALACVLAGWRNLPTPYFRPWHWLTLVIGSVGAISFSWTLQPRNGLVAGVIVVAGLLLGTILALVLRKHARGSALNIAGGFITAVSAPVCGLLAATVLSGTMTSNRENKDALELLHQAVEINPASTEAFSDRQWNVPFLWLLAALAVWGIWRSFRHGLILWRGNKLPVSWLLLLFAIVNLSLLPQCSRSTALLPVLSSAVLIGVFGVGDFFRRIGQSLILRPPHERVE